MKFVIFGGILIILLITWSLCQAASLADQSMEEDFARFEQRLEEERNRPWPHNETHNERD